MRHLHPSSILGWDLNWNGKARLYTIHYDHRLEALNVRVLIEESPGELLIIVHGARGNVEDKVSVARDVESIDDFNRRFDGLLKPINYTRTFPLQAH